MATTDSNFFEIQRRGAQWNKNSTLDDEVSSMLWDSDPNDAVTGVTDGETKLVAMPIGAQFIQSNGVLWFKKKMPNVWAEIKATETFAAMELYVDTGGDDDTGDGSVGSPYETITRAYEDVPFLLKHPVQIKIATGTYTAFPEVIKNECQETGQLIFDGLGGNSDDEGDLTVAAITFIHGTLARAVAFDIEISGAPGWTPNEHAEKFIYIKTGVNAGHYLGIWSNTADTLRVNGGYNPMAPAAADTINIGSPQVIINASEPTSMQVFNNKYFGQSDYDAEVRSSVGIGFIKLNYAKQGLRLNKTQIFIASSIIESAEANGFAVYAEDSAINYNTNTATDNPFPDPAKGFTVSIELTAFGGAQCIINSRLVCPRGAAVICGCLITNQIYLENYGSIVVFFCSAKHIYTIMATLYVSYSYVEYPDYSHAAIEVYNSGLQLIHSYCESGAGFTRSFVSKLWMKDCENNAAGCYFILLADSDSSYTLLDNTLGGVAGEIYWMQTASSENIPAAGSAVTDSQGGWVRNMA